MVTSRDDGANRRVLALPFWLDRPPLEALDVARAAEAAGWDELWVGEMASFDAFALAGAIARTTARIELTVGPLPVTLRDPVALAMGVSSVAELGGRSAHLALGASSALVTAGWHGVRAPASVGRFRETVALCRSLFAGERSDVSGDHVTSHGFRLRLGAAGATVSIAAFGPKLLDLAAVVADRVVLAHVTTDQVRAVRARIDATAAAAGVAPPRLVVWVSVGIGDAAAEQIRRALVAYVGQRGYADMFHAAGFAATVELARSGAGPKEVLAALPPTVLDAVSACGDAERIRARLDAVRAAGADDVCVVPSTASEGGVEAVLAAAG
jgi:probable F420-dependent oxidoreductase